MRTYFFTLLSTSFRFTPIRIDDGDTCDLIRHFVLGRDEGEKESYCGLTHSPPSDWHSDKILDHARDAISSRANHITRLSNKMTVQNIPLDAMRYCTSS